MQMEGTSAAAQRQAHCEARRVVWAQQLNMAGAQSITIHTLQITNTVLP